MLRRALYLFLLVVVAIGFCTRGVRLVRSVFDGTAGIAYGLLEAAYLAGMLALGFVVVRELRDSARPKGNATGSEASRTTQESSFAKRLAHLQAVSRQAYVRNPALAIVKFVLTFLGLAALPIIMLAASRRSGMGSFGTSEWILVGFVEVPIAFVMVVVVLGFVSSKEPSN